MKSGYRIEVARLWGKTRFDYEPVPLRDFLRYTESPSEVERRLAELLSQHDIGKTAASFQWFTGSNDPTGEQLCSARERVRESAKAMQRAENTNARRAAARDFLAAVAELVLCLLCFLVRALLTLMSRSLGRTSANHTLVWQPEPIEESPQITPRGPNTALPVSCYRGGRRSSALGNVVVAA